MLKMLFRDIHQSYFVVFMCAGIVAGAVVGLWLEIDFFASPMWAVLAVILMVLIYLWPKTLFVVAAFGAGLILAWCRVAGELAVQRKLGETYKAAAGLETEAWVVWIRDWFAGRIKGLIPEPEVSLGLSYLMGMKTGLPDSLAENLRTVGLVHIVVASGAHLSILVEIARRIFGKISRFTGLLCSILLVVFFMAMVGWTPSIMRAGLMTLLTLVAWYSGRKMAPWRLILMVAAVTLMMQPVFVMNMGWQLSFASYGGIMLLGPKLTKYFYGVRKPGMIGSLILTTVAATMMTLPIILYHYGMMSLVSVVANILILPTLPWVMGLMFMTGVVASVPGIGVAVAWCTTKMLDYHMAVVGWFAGMREFVIEMPRYQWWVFLIYATIVGVLARGLIWKKRRKVVKLGEAE